MTVRRRGMGSHRIYTCKGREVASDIAVNDDLAPQEAGFYLEQQEYDLNGEPLYFGCTNCEHYRIIINTY